MARTAACCQGFVISILDSEDTEQADLRGGRSPWFATSGQPSRLEVRDNLTCDALIVGAGITGSLVAERLTRQGLDVVIVDRELPGRGSTVGLDLDAAMGNRPAAAATERSLRFRARRARLSRQPRCRCGPEIARRPSSALPATCATRIRCILRRIKAAQDCSKSIAGGRAPACPAIFSTTARCSTVSASRVPRRSSPPARPMPIPCNWRTGCSELAIARGARLFEARPSHSMPPDVR